MLLKKWKIMLYKYILFFLCLSFFIVLLFYSNIYTDKISLSNNYNVNILVNTVSSKALENIISYERQMLFQELEDYVFPINTTINNYLFSKGGQPFRNIIVTTWRSGSTFLGEILNSVPGNFYHYEPLLDYGIIRIRGPPFDESALTRLESLFSCDYSNLNNYIEYGKNHTYLFTHNTRLWNLCQLYPQLCWTPNFFSEICKLFPFQSMKIVRLRLKLLEKLIRNERFNFKVLLLIRDPRGTIQSRKHRDWCPGQPDCDQPNLLCEDMVSDYKAAIRFRKLYPKKIKVVRFEDLSNQPYQAVQEIFDFLGINMHQNVVDYLNSHTKVNIGGVSSTFRHSKAMAFHWKDQLTISEIQMIENNCDVAMKLWGYVKFNNISNFIGVTSLKLNRV